MQAKQEVDKKQAKKESIERLSNALRSKLSQCSEISHDSYLMLPQSYKLTKAYLVKDSRHHTSFRGDVRKIDRMLSIPPTMSSHYPLFRSDEDKVTRVGFENRHQEVNGTTCQKLPYFVHGYVIDYNHNFILYLSGPQWAKPNEKRLIANINKHIVFKNTILIITDENFDAELKRVFEA